MHLCNTLQNSIFKPQLGGRGEEPAKYLAVKCSALVAEVH